jgi:hypothetical protein
VDGLKTKVNKVMRDVLVPIVNRLSPIAFEECVSLFCDIVYNLLDNAHHNKRTVPPRRSENVGDPMQLDKVSVPRGPLNSAAKSRRHKLNLCLYCGENGHYAANYPNMKSKLTSSQVGDDKQGKA